MFFSFVRPQSAMRLITGTTGNSNINDLYPETGWSTIRDRAEAAMIIMLYIKKSLCPTYFLEVLLPQPNHRYIEYNLRNKDHIRLPFTRLELSRRSFLPTAIYICLLEESYFLMR